MGLTTRAHPREQHPNGRKLPKGVDPAPEPEVDDTSVDLLTAYVRFLAAPAREVPATDATADSIRRGERIFERIGCEACHSHAFTTGTNAPAALSNRRIDLYSDLLLHDLGDELATVCSPNASPSEWRTTPLMGLRHRQQLLHDGRAQTLHAASRDRFRLLSEAERGALLRFLRSL